MHASHGLYPSLCRLGEPQNSILGVVCMLDPSHYRGHGQPAYIYLDGHAYVNFWLLRLVGCGNG
jgi:hypothetical protein